ncbi:hypothetical protein D3C80_1088070 [compost metagenome]
MSLTTPHTRRCSSPLYHTKSSHGWSSTAPKSMSGSGLANSKRSWKGPFSPSSRANSATTKVLSGKAPTLTVNCNPVLSAIGAPLL